jgi:hypothetical protein
MRFCIIERTEAGYYLDPEPYVRQIQAHAAEMRAEALAFAGDGDHYDFYSDRCAKDLKLDRIEAVDHSGSLSMIADFRFNELPNVPRLKVRYKQVTQFSIVLKGMWRFDPTRRQSRLRGSGKFAR